MNLKNIASNETNEINDTKEAEKSISIKNSKALNKRLNYYYKNPPLIGLQNIGEISYMNATLQCFSNIEKLTCYFKFDSYIKEIIKNKPNGLTASYKLIIDKLWPSNTKNNNKYYSPFEFNKKLASLSPLFQVGQPNDAKDLMNFIIYTLYEELNIRKDNNNNDHYIDQTNEQLVFRTFIEKYNKNNSIISDLFYGIIKIVVKCSKCKISKYSFTENFFFIFPLEEIRKYKLKELQVNNNDNIMNEKEKNFKIHLLNKNIVDIKDCFDHEQKIELFTGDEAMYCNNCNELSDATFQVFSHSLPQILIFIFNRGKGPLNKIKVKFNELLDLNNYSQNGGIYELISVVTYLGENRLNGHFISSCKSPIDNQWYRYNDVIITKITDIKKDILDFGYPYVLFYKRK